MTRRARVLFVLLFMLSGCNEMRARTEPPTVFAEIDPILEEACVECHGTVDPAAGYSVVDNLETIRCVPDGQPATRPSDATAPILAVLEQPDHAQLLDEDQTQGLTTWVVEGAWPARNGTHPGQWLDPRTPAWHGTYLRQTDWQPIVDPTRSDACGLCHAGSPAPVDGITNFPPGAQDCTDCHDLPGGVMACGTCHGDGLRPYPPRDQCYFPGPPFGGAHMAHTESSAILPTPLSCQACHFGQDYSMLDGIHGNGVIDVIFQPAWGSIAGYDFDSMACATTCHIRGGTMPMVSWDETFELDCGSCHQALPPGHSPIACTGCHRGINAEGTELVADAPHINGRVDAF